MGKMGTNSVGMKGAKKHDRKADPYPLHDYVPYII